MVILGVLLYFGMERVWRREAAAVDATETAEAAESAPLPEDSAAADTDSAGDYHA